MSSNAVASSSKRSAPSTTSTPAKRAKPSNKAESVADDMSDVEEDGGCDGTMDEAARAKALRKEARTIRNRESAQRSRNQRKAHLVFLEQRVNELEAENRALRAGETPPPRASTSSSPKPSAEREASPAQSVISLANDLGIPPEIVSSSGGVSLANVAPPPADLENDVKPIITPPSPVSAQQSIASFGDVTLSSLQSENANLKERIGLLENLVKQVVALANLSGLPATSNTAALPPKPVRSISTASEQHPLDWDALVNSTQNNNLEATLSPPMYPIQPLAPTQPSLDLTPSLPSIPAFPSVNTEMNLACHPAVMVTCTAKPSQALQRARNNSLLGPTEMSSERLEVMAKVIVELARLRGMSSHSHSIWNKAQVTKACLDPRRKHRLITRLRCKQRQQRSRRDGMRG